MPHSLSDDPRDRRALRAIVFVASAAAAAVGLRFAWDEPLMALAMLCVSFAALGGRWLSRRRLRRLLHSGDVDSVLQRWSPSLARIPHAGTMGPLMTATAFAAYGWIGKARAALASAERGPAWDDAIEHWLFLDAMLLAFEGDRDAAIERSDRLLRLPLPPTGPLLRERIETLRKAVGALARAFAHCTVAGDVELLEEASKSSPLMFWAMRYAAAVVAVDHGELIKARDLLHTAPDWPEESAFRSFHEEIAHQLDAAG